MTDLSVNSELLNKGATDPLARWLVSSTFLIAGVLAAALIGAALGTPRSGAIDEVVASELPSITTINMSAPQSVRTAAAPTVSS